MGMTIIQPLNGAIEDFSEDASGTIVSLPQQITEGQQSALEF
jgi:hypothetical protein